MHARLIAISAIAIVSACHHASPPQEPEPQEICTVGYLLKVLYMELDSPEKNSRYDEAYALHEEANKLNENQQYSAAARLHLKAAKLFTPTENTSKRNQEVLNYNRKISHQAAKESLACAGGKEGLPVDQANRVDRSPPTPPKKVSRCCRAACSFRCQ